jgi:hypothetical protein
MGSGKDGVFTQEQKAAAKKASRLNKDALDLQMKE